MDILYFYSIGFDQFATLLFKLLTFSFIRLTIELDKEKLISNKHKDDSKKLLEDLTSLQEMYDKTSMELVKTKDIEIKLKEDYERATYDLEMCRER